MKWLSLVLIFVSFLSCLSVSAKHSTEPVYSTQGVEIDASVAASKPSVDDKNEQKEIRNRSRKYIKYQKTLDKQNAKKTAKEKELEYLQNRLEQKKNKLETMFSDNVKGEQE